VFCFDGDEAGRKAAWRALETTLPQMEDGRQVRFLFLPEGMDPDDYVRQRGQDAFVQAVAEATALEDYFYRKLAEDIDLETSQGKARLSNLAKPLLRTLPRGVFAQLMLDRLSETLNVDKQSMDALLMEQPAESETPPAPPFAPPLQGLDAPPPQAPESAMPGLGFARARQTTRPGLQRRPNSLKAIELLLRNPDLALTLEQDLSPLRAAEDESRQLLLALIEMVQSDPHTETYTLLGYCYGTSLGGQLTQLLKAEKITPLDGMEREFGQIIDSILSDIRKKLELVQLKSELKSRVSAAKDRN